MHCVENPSIPSKLLTIGISPEQCFDLCPCEYVWNVQDLATNGVSHAAAQIMLLSVLHKHVKTCSSEVLQHDNTSVSAHLTLCNLHATFYSSPKHGLWLNCALLCSGSGGRCECDHKDRSHWDARWSKPCEASQVFTGKLTNWLKFSLSVLHLCSFTLNPKQGAVVTGCRLFSQQLLMNAKENL